MSLLMYHFCSPGPWGHVATASLAAAAPCPGGTPTQLSKAEASSMPLSPMCLPPSCHLLPPRHQDGRRGASSTPPPPSRPLPPSPQSSDSSTQKERDAAGGARPHGAMDKDMPGAPGAVWCGVPAPKSISPPLTSLHLPCRPGSRQQAQLESCLPICSPHSSRGQHGDVRGRACLSPAQDPVVAFHCTSNNV